MEEIYNKLNWYLKDICNYLEKECPHLLEHIDEICNLNDAFLQFIEKYSLDNRTMQNHLTYEECYLLAREIVEHIDKNYLVSFDRLIESGELDFGFENEYSESHCVSMYTKGQVKQMINIKRKFNYDDVRALVHEFIHYTNGTKDSTMRRNLTEFLSTYFDFYTVDYLLEKGINEKEIDYFHRMKSLKQHSFIFFQYETVLLAYIKFGNLDSNTFLWVQKYLQNIKKETFEKECSILYKCLCYAEKRNKERIEQCPNLLGKVLSEEFITKNYRYLFGTFLSIYAYKYSNFDDIVYLNNHMNESDGKTLYDICLSIGIDLEEKDFPHKLFIAIDEYIRKKQVKYNLGISN